MVGLTDMKRKGNNMQLTKDQVTNEAQSAIMTVFAKDFKDMLAEDSGNHIHAIKADKLICNSVVNADDDAGEWSREAMVIIYHVNGMPSINRIEEWCNFYFNFSYTLTIFINRYISTP